MIRNLINLGLVVTPYLCWQGMDTRQPKQVFSLVICLSIALLGIYKGMIKGFDNRFALLFILYLFIANLFVPQFKGLNLGSQNLDGLWNYKPLFQIVVYFLALVVIANIPINSRRIDAVFSIMAYSGLVMSLYVIVQSLNIDQIFTVKPYEKIGWVTNPNLAGTLGQPTVVSPFILMCIPMMIYIRKYWLVLPMVFAIVLTKSDIAIGAMGLMAYIWFFSRNKFRMAVGGGALGLFLLTLLCFQEDNSTFIRHLVNDNGRFDVWINAVKDVTQPLSPTAKTSFALTGLGLGSFPYLFPIKHNSTFVQAHNEYIQLFYGTGLIGLTLGLLAIWDMVNKAVVFYQDRQMQCLLYGFLASALCALGTFVWQLGAHILYVIVITGLIHNLTRRKQCVLV